MTRTDTTLALAGLHCAGCVGRAERALAQVPGVVTATVNLATSEAAIHHQPGLAIEALFDAIRQAGYTATRAAEVFAPLPDEAPALRRAALLACLLALPALVLEMGSHLVPAIHHAVAGTLGTGVSWWVQAGFATAALFGPGWQFQRLGWPALWRAAPDMNTLVAIGTVAAWLFSGMVLLVPDWLPEGQRQVYFEATSVIIALVLLGRWLEARARGEAGRAIRGLMELVPSTARVERGGAEQTVAIASLVVGDIVLVRPGESLPADGVVLDGSSEVAEALLTGEAMPVPKGPGDAVVGGTVNGAGALRVRLRAVGSGTVLAQITRMVQTAQAGKLPIQAVVDRVTLWFVPAVLVLALATLGGWLVAGAGLAMALTAAVAVLIIACPCAMGLATPIAILVGTGRAARLGVLFRDGAAIQMLSGISCVALDKTGTLTEGRPTLTELLPADGFTAAEVLMLAAAAEARSEHPLAQAVRAAADRIVLPPMADFAVVAGGGVSAKVSGRVVLLGSAAHLEASGIALAPLAAEAERLAGQGRTVFFAAVDGRLAALLAVADGIRRSTPEGLAKLRALGLDVAMVTGDGAVTAAAVARDLGIDHVWAGASPAGKVAALDMLRKGGRKVAFVGDGLNDAPVLAAADVGIAMGGGTDIARESAGVVLMQGDLRGVSAAVRISRATMANIRQNLVWAFGYNALLVPVAALGLLSPVLAAGAMALSASCVVGNALRLRRA